LKSPQVGGVAHGRPPIPVQNGDVEHLRVGTQDGDDSASVPEPNCLLKRVGYGMRGDTPLECSPVRESIFPRDDKLRVTELDRGGAESILWEIPELRVAPEDAIEAVAFALSALLKKFARLAFGNIEMGPRRQTPRNCRHNLPPAICP
jgi:hypothetical protein